MQADSVCTNVLHPLQLMPSVRQHAYTYNILCNSRSAVAALQVIGLDIPVCHRRARGCRQLPCVCRALEIDVEPAC